MQKIKFKVESLRKIPNPYGIFMDDTKRKAPEMIFAIVDIRELPDNIPTKTNPREQNMRTKVAGRIKDGLLSEHSPFFILNRGILLSAQDVKFDNANSELTIFIEDETVHGNVDGGHTYKTILDYRDKLGEDTKQYARIEILTGIEDIFEDVAAARNTSVQVQDKAIAELKQKFNMIKEAIESEPFKDNIAYRENEDKDIDVADILTLLYMFNLEKHDNREKMAVSAYSSKQTCVKEYTTAYDHYEKENNVDNNPYYKMKNVMTDIFKLYDLIETSMARKYREVNNGGMYGRVKGVEVPKSETKFKSKFYKKNMEHRTPKGFLYPIVGAFRALLAEKDGVYYWKADPMEYFEEIGKNLVGDTVERSRTLGNNPNAVGKDTGTWKQLYNNVLTQYLLNQAE
ncbi:AIPR family protein [Peribacillus frigoritolerans]